MDFSLSFNELMRQMALSVVPFLFAVTIHEVMHGYAAYKLGDNTAKDAGRLTLNPFVHIDILGLIVLLLTRIIGWAKPVPVNYNNLNHKYGVAIVSAAGPLANLITAFLSALVLKLYVVFGLPYIDAAISHPVILMIKYSISINIVLCFFNLIPIMPMDGARIIWNFLPRDKAYAYEKTESFYFIIILVLILSQALYYIISPIQLFFINLFSKIFNLGMIL